MVSKTMVVKAAEGLHMRPAGVIAREAGKFDSDVTIVFGDKRINAKSLVNIIARQSLFYSATTQLAERHPARNRNCRGKIAGNQPRIIPE